MLGYLVLGVCLLAAVLLGASWFINANPQQLARLIRYLSIGLLGAGGVVCLLIGRIAFGIPMLALAMAIFRGWRMSLPNFPAGAMRKPASGQASKVDTEYLSMTLEHDTGVMAGQVIKGAYAGKSLAELSLQQLIALFSECYRNDEESARLLDTYLERTIGPDWRESAQDAGMDETETKPGRGWGARDTEKPIMSKDEACDVLGVKPDANADQIKDAYRRLMQKHHPDQGGSTYLAAKINQAKDVLLGV